MVKKQDEIQDDSRQGAEKIQNAQQRVEHRKPEQQQRNRVNSQGYHQNQRGQNQFHQKNSAPVAVSAAAEQASGSREGQPVSQNHPIQAVQNASQSHNPAQPRSGAPNPRNLTNHHENNPREAGQGKGYYRDRNKDTERDSQPRQHPLPTGGRYSPNLRNKPEESIDDIKEDIVRLEKEIELEIKDIKSLKL